MERRVLLAITLSFLVLFLFQRFVMPPPAPLPGNASAPAPDQAAVDRPAGAATSQNTSAPSPAPAAAPAPVAQIATTLGESSAREIVVETSKVKATFSNRGGVITHWILKEFRNDSGQPLDLVPAGAGADATKPFALSLDDKAQTTRLNDAIYRVTVDGAAVGEIVDATAQPKTIVFEAAAADGLSVKKTFHVEPTSYVVTFGANVQANGQRQNPSILWGPGLGDEIARAKPASFFSPSYNTPAQAIIHKVTPGTLWTSRGFERVPATAAAYQEGGYLFAGVDDHYFASLLLNEKNTQAFRIDYAPVYVPQADDPAVTGRYVAYSIRFQHPQDASRFFFGPKTFDDLRSVDPEATRAINFGIFSWLAVPLLGALKWVHGYIGNWGWAIIVLTILINIALFPLRHKSVVSMRKMQQLQPQLKAIQDRYAKYKVTDPERQKMNTEVMELYRSKGVNPASGCLPTLLTFPFLFGFYNMLSQSIEIRGANFAGWIHNLSAPDPFYILPIVFGAIQVYQMKITPTAGDPAQQKVMMMMPIMFTAMSLSFPSGLVMYWLVSTILAILQQQLTSYMTSTPAKAGAK
jgi:YidC/Oxa1 family membrane protein insertase